MRSSCLFLVAIILASTLLTSTVVAVAHPLEPRLTTPEKSSLQFMVQEEKLAMDVYTYLNSLWGSKTNTFGNILKSEAKHADAVRTLLKTYGIADPTLGTKPGVYTDPTLQSLYTTLIATGRNSLRDALLVGITIEKTDIVDLDARLAETKETAIITVYNSLRAGSVSHLAAFNNALGKLPKDATSTEEPVVVATTTTTTAPAAAASSASATPVVSSAGKGKGWRGGRIVPAFIAAALFA